MMKLYLNTLAGIAVGLSVIAIPVQAQPSSGDKPELTTPQIQSNTPPTSAQEAARQPTPANPAPKQTLPTQTSPSQANPGVNGAVPPQNAPMRPQQSTMSDDQIDARYKAAREQCDALSGDQKDVCVERAKAEKDVAEAQRKADRKKSKADEKVADTRREANYDVEMKKCDTMSGDAKDKCQDDTKARFDK